MKHHIRHHHNVTVSPHVSSYRQFVKTNFPVVKASHPGSKPQEIMKQIAVKWHQSK